MKIQTYNDAETFINKSGVVDWEFEGDANLEDLTEFVYSGRGDEIDADLVRFVRDMWDNETDQKDDDQFNNLLCDYLESVGEHISDYSLKRIETGAQK